ncbi:MAG: radical SAM protein [Methanomassiliicoccus sp.]|nr:radical SAM protein [Methanomassiliicoccus sp.]
MVDAVTFYRPGRRFPAFSVTGGRCELQCDHCRGRFLAGMRPALTPRDLEAAARELAASGGTGLLLSGGCDARGRVPLAPFLGTVLEIKRTTALAVNLHPGLVDREAAQAIMAAGADALSVDVLQDPATIRDVLHLGASPDDYRRTLELLAPSGRLVPHVCVGLQSEGAEDRTLDLLSSFPLRSLVVLGLISAPGAPRREVSSERLLGFVRRAVREVGAPVLLGCMRPRGRWQDEAAAIEAGVAGVVNPSTRTVEWAASEGRHAAWREECCALGP